MGLGWVLLELRLTSRKSLCCTCFFFPDVRLEEQGVPAGTAAAEQEAEGLPPAGPSLLGVLSEAGGERVVVCETGEVCQVPKAWESVSGVGGEFVLRPRDCCGCAWQWRWWGCGSFLQPPA